MDGSEDDPRGGKGVKAALKLVITLSTCVYLNVPTARTVPYKE